MAYILFVQNSTNAFQMSIREFAEKLQEKWSNVQITLADDAGNGRIFEWNIHNAIDEWFHGYISRAENENDFLNIDSSPTENIALFACWYRTLVPNTSQLFLFHPSWDGSASILIDINTSVEAIQSQLNRCEASEGV